MSEFDSSSPGHEPPPSSSSRDLIVVVQHPEAKPAAEPRRGERTDFSRPDSIWPPRRRLRSSSSVAGALFLEDRQQAKALAERASETKSLAHALKSLKVRLDAIDTTVSSADLADLRQSIGEIKSTVVSPREVSGALAQLSQRVDKLDRDESAKVDKLTERVDHEASALTTGLSTRIDKLEQKIAAPPPRRPRNPCAGQAAADPSEIRQRLDGHDEFNRTAETPSAGIRRARCPR